MSADWKAGDKAVCVDDSPPRNEGHPNAVPGSAGTLKRGTIYLVSDALLWNDGALTLVIAGVPGTMDVSNGLRAPWCATRFRKVVPQCDRQAVAQEREAGV